MSETDESSDLQEEPQSERGPMGSRDEGGPPGSGPTARPAGDPHSGDDTSVDEQDTAQEGMDKKATGD